MSLSETLAYIHNVKWQGSKPGLQRTRELLSKLGNPEKQLKFVHVAGTNGKGSTSICIATILEKAGYTTGLYTSPFVECFNERMQVNGENISDDELIRMTDEIRPYADAMEDSPTEFELITALAMNYFLYKKCDIVVLEVGMGGRLDSTNVIPAPELAVITSIGYDHVKELGPRLCDIAREKAGIIKKGGEVLVYGGDADIENVFESIAAEQGARLYKADFKRIEKQEISLDGIKLKIKPYDEVLFPLIGAYQPYNATLAITALELLRAKGYKIRDDEITSAISSVKWPGRFEVLGRSPVFILDGSHNPQGMEATAKSLKMHFGDKKITFIVGVMADKDVDSMMAHIAPCAKMFITVKPDNPRAMDSGELAERLKHFGVPVMNCAVAEKGVSEALRLSGNNDIICALGSLYFSAEVRFAYNHNIC